MPGKHSANEVASLAPRGKFVTTHKHTEIYRELMSALTEDKYKYVKKL